nr:restriction endonuclease [Corynebacterium glutamicum]
MRHTRDFEELSADLLRAIGYQARLTQYSQDGGVNVIAHKDALGIERQRPDLRLLLSEDIVTLIMDNYKKLPERWRRVIPLTPVLVVSDEAE